MKIYKDTVKSFFVTLAAILAIAAVGFLIGSWLLKPKQPSQQDLSYKAKVAYPNGPIKLTYWRTAEDKMALDAILVRWKQMHPNVSIEVVNIPLLSYEKKLNDAVSSNTLPDMFMIKPDWLPRYISSTQPSPTEVFSEGYYKKIFAPIVANQLIRDGKVRAVSYSLPTLGLIYNQDLFTSAGIDSPPSSWQDLVDDNSKLVKKSGNGLISSGIALGTAGVSNSASILPMLMMQNGAIMTNTPPTEATFQKLSADNYPSAIKALDFYTSFARPGKSTYSWSDGFGDSTQAFAKGKTAMIIDYPNKISGIKAISPGLNLKVAKIPQLNPGSPINYADYWAETVSKSTKYPEIAWDFYNYMTSYEIMNMYSVATAKPASRLDLAKYQQTDPIIGPFASQVPSAQNYYKGNISLSDTAMLEMINSVLAGYDPAIAVRAGSDKVTTAISQFPY